MTRVFARVASRVADEHATLTPDDVIEAVHGPGEKASVTPGSTVELGRYAIHVDRQ